MNPSTTITLVDGVKIVVPDSLDLITPYVLREQEDWFEDEIKFLRRLLEPGQKVIDIGANYGVYTLCMAKAVGPVGTVWAFEPTSKTAALLADGIAANGFTQVTLDRRALSGIKGKAQLSLNQNSELNALIHDQSMTGASETVSLVTLDDCMETYGWRDIDFLKIDAEGEEANIIAGGKQFFSMLSPLVQYEVKAGADLHLELVKTFASIGYRSYRLVPALDILIPFDANKSPTDPFLLNLFCCKPDRAALLAANGHLLDSESQSKSIARREVILKTSRPHAPCDWNHALAELPYGAQLADLWEQKKSQQVNGDLGDALYFYARSQDSSLLKIERFFSLEASLFRLKSICKREPSHMRLASLARVAKDYGSRLLAVNALVQLSNAILTNKQADLSEPFLVPDSYFDVVAPGRSIGDWALCAVLEGLERAGSYSSFYTGLSAQQRLEIIADLGYGSEEMDRRLGLLQQRFETPREQDR